MSRVSKRKNIKISLGIWSLSHQLSRVYFFH